MGLRPDLVIRQVFTPSGASLPTPSNPAVLIGVHRAFSYRANAGSFVGGQDNGDYLFPGLIEGSAVEPTTSDDVYLRPQVLLSNDYGVADITDAATFAALSGTSATPSFALSGGLSATFQVATGTSGAYDSATGAFTDPLADFISRGVAAGDTIEIGGVPAFTVTSLASDDELTVTRANHGPTDARISLGPKDAYGMRVLSYLGTAYDGFVSGGAKVGELVDLDGWDERVTTGGLSFTAADAGTGLRTLTEASAFGSVAVGDVVLLKDALGREVPTFVATSGGSSTIFAATLPGPVDAADVAGSDGFPERFFRTVRLTAGLIGPRTGGAFTAQDGDGERTFSEAGYDFAGAGVDAGDWVLSFKAYSGVVGSVVVGATTLTRASGSWLDDGFADDMPVMLLLAEDSANKQRLVIDTVTDTVMTFVAGTSLTVNADDDTLIVASQDFTPLFEVVSAADGSMAVADFTNDVLAAAEYGGPLVYVVAKNIAAVSGAASSGAYVSAATSELRSIGWPDLLTGSMLPTADEFVFNDEGVLLFLVEDVVTSSPGAEHTSLAFDHTAGTITRTGGTSFLTTGFAVGTVFGVHSSENTGENDGTYRALTVTSTVITVDTSFASLLATNATDTTAVLQSVTVSDHEQAGADLGATDVINNIGLSIRQADTAQYSIVRVVSEQVLNVRHVVSGDELPDTTVVGATISIKVADELDEVEYAIEKTATGAGLLGDVLVTYAQRRRDHVDELILLDAATISAAGPAVPGNPLGMAASFAVDNAGGQPVYLLQVGDDTTDGWAAAREALKTSQVYALAPLTQDETQLTAFRALVEAESAVDGKREKILFQSHRFQSQTTRWTMSGAETAYYFNAGATETIEVTTATGLVALGVRAGDVAEGAYAGFSPSAGFVTGSLTARVVGVSESGGVTTLTLLPVATHVATQADGMQLTTLAVKSKALSSGQLRDAIAAYPATIASRRVRNLYPDQATVSFDDPTNPADTSVGVYGGGEVASFVVGGWLLCAAAAAMRAGLPASAPLTGRSMSGFRTLVNPFTSTADLDTILDAGNYLLAQPSGPFGGVQAVRAVTTDVSDLLRLEESATMQVDSFARRLRRAISPVLGSTVLDQAFFDLYSTLASSVMTDVIRRKEMREIKFVSIAEDPDRADTFVSKFLVRPFLSAAHGDIEIETVSVPI